MIVGYLLRVRDIAVISAHSLEILDTPYRSSGYGILHKIQLDSHSFNLVEKSVTWTLSEVTKEE